MEQQQQQQTDQQQVQQQQMDSARTGESSENDPLLQSMGSPMGSPQDCGSHLTHHHIEMQSTIYAAILYAPAINRIKHGNSWSKKTNRVCFMIALNLVVQIGLLRIMYIYSHRDSMGAQLITEHKSDSQAQASKDYGNFLKPHDQTSHGWSALLSPWEQEVVNKADAKNAAICHMDSHGKFTCSPPSTRFVSEWAALDTDGDGIWNISEVMGDYEGKESEEMDPVVSRHIIFFNSIIGGLKHRADWIQQFNRTLHLSKDILAGTGIQKAFFDYWVGDAMFCTKFGSSSCKKIVASGLFDAALTKGRIAAGSKGIFDYTSAVNYCTMMLDDHGGCEQSLPATYEGAMARRHKECGGLSLTGAGVMTNPRDPKEVLQVMTPTYRHLTLQIDASHPTFIFFHIIIFYLFYASLIDEVRDILKVIDFLVSFPSFYNSEDRGGVDLGPSAEKRYNILRIGTDHRVLLSLIVLLRASIIIVLMQFGTWFLLEQELYMELVLNALALVFITGVDEMMYDYFLETSDKLDMGFDNVEHVKYTGHIPKDGTRWAGYLFRKDSWGLYFAPFMAICVVMYHNRMMRHPIIDALTCTCLQEGSNCMESLSNQGAWWQNYWSHTLPAAIHKIEAMRLQGL